MGRQGEIRAEGRAAPKTKHPVPSRELKGLPVLFTGKTQFTEVMNTARKSAELTEETTLDEYVCRKTRFQVKGLKTNRH